MRIHPTIALSIGFLAALLACQTPASVQHPSQQADTSTLARVMRQAGLVDVQSLDTSLRIELRYASPNNFVGSTVYPHLHTCFLQPIAAQKLAHAHTLLRQTHPEHRFLIYDGARPRRVQQVFWDKLQVPDSLKSHYVANPATGSVHNFGCAVDLTIVGPDGQPLDMGTDFDHFGHLAYPIYEDSLLRIGQLHAHQVANRQLLRQAMLAAGFHGIDSEWWHFNALTRDSARVRYGIIE